MLAFSYLFRIALVFCACWIQLARATPSFETVRARFQASDRILQDRNGLTLNEMRLDKTVRRLDWISLHDISPTFQTAVLLAEDRRFYDHWGFDWRALGAAAIERLRGRKLRGASTIPMQLASALSAHSSKISRGHERKTMWGKAKEIFASIELSARWSKAQILEAYLNLVYFRGELQGVSAASQGLFRRHPIALNEEESMVLAALIRSPNAPLGTVSLRACMLLKSRHPQTPCSTLDLAVKSALSIPYSIGERVESAPQVAHLLRRELMAAPHGTLRTTLDLGLQLFATDVLRRQLQELRSQNMKDGAVLVLDNASGDVLAYVANAGELSTARFVDGIRAQRQAGSTLKPILYGKAIEAKLLTAATLLRDSPLEISVESGSYVPHNYDHQFKSFVSARVALAASLNIPAVRTVELLGVDHFVQTLADFGIELPERADFYGPSLALGSGDVTLWDLTNAYRALANDGIWSAARLLPSIQTGHSRKQVLKTSASYIIKNILSDRDSRSATFGPENSLSTRFWTAVKTGTSKDMRDNWCIGFSEQFTVGVWTGNFSGDAMWNVSGVDGAAPVWLSVMNYLHNRTLSRPPAIPPDVVSREINFVKSGQKRTEFFLQGTEPENSEIQPQDEVETRIAYPIQNTRIAMDPRMSSSISKVYFQIVHPQPGYALYLNGKAQPGPLQEYMLWSPKPGFYRLTLKDREQSTVDEVTFVVRGPRRRL